MILDHEPDALNNVPDKVKQKIHTIDKNKIDCAMVYNRAIQYVLNTLKNIHLNSELFCEFYTTFYNDKICF